jgi:cytidyltransferase-like protein
MTADLFHRGHVEFLKSAKNLHANSILIVGIHSDITCIRYKRIPIIPMEDRIEIIRACRYVDEVIPDAPLIVTDEYLDKYHIDHVIAANCPGNNIEETDFYNKNYCDAIKRGIISTIPYYHGISTTIIINKIRENI